MKDHCVISPSSSHRTWCSEDDAVAYAKRILTQKGSAPKLFVVKIVKVVELAQTPTTVREFVPEDIG